MRVKIICINIDVGDAFQFMGQGIPQSGGSNSECRISALPRILGTRALLLDNNIIIVHETNM